MTDQYRSPIKDTALLQILGINPQLYQTRTTQHNLYNNYHYNSDVMT